MALGGAAGAAGLAAGATVGALASLTGAITSLTKVVTNQVTKADEMQKSTLGIGLSLSQFNEKTAPSIVGLRGDLKDKIAIGLKALESGLQGNIKGVAELANQQMLTGQNWQATLGVFAGVQAMGNLQNKALNSLADHTKEVGQIYSVQTSKLTDSINDLKSSMISMNLAGMGENVLKAQASMAGQLGPQFAGSLATVMNKILSPSLDNLSNLAVLGIADIRERLSAATTQQQAQKILMEGIMTAGQSFQDLVGNAEDFYGGIGVAAGIVGDEFMHLIPLMQQFQKGGRDQQKEATKWTETIGLVWREIFNPVREFFVENHAKFKVIGEGIGLIAQAFVKGFADRFQKFAEGFDPQKLMDSIMGIAIQAGDVFDAIMQPVGRFIEFVVGISEKTLSLLSKVEGVAKTFNFGTMGVEMGLLTMKGLFLDTQADWEDLGNKWEKNKKTGQKYDFTIPLISDNIAQLVKSMGPLGSVPKNLEKIAQNTAKPVDAPNFLNFSANMLNESMRSVLGFNNSVIPYLETMIDELSKVSNNTRESIDVGAGA